MAVAGFYFLLGAQIIGFLQLIVYAGAIMVLIVFVIMLLNIGDEGHLRRSGRVQRFAAPVLTLLFAAVPHAEQDIPAHGEMGKKGKILEHQSDPAGLGRHMDT